MDFVTRLDACNNFPCIFELVKSAVKRTTGKSRVGLILGLTNLPSSVGALHQLGSNFIIMNKRLLEAVIRLGNKKMINAYVFHLLLHEYIHSLGYVNEEQTQTITYAITEKVLGLGHPATLIARHGISYVLSTVAIDGSYDARKDRKIEIVRDIDIDNLNYFG